MWRDDTHENRQNSIIVQQTESVFHIFSNSTITSRPWYHHQYCCCFLSVVVTRQSKVWPLAPLRRGGDQGVRKKVQVCQGAQQSSWIILLLDPLATSRTCRPWGRRWIANAAVYVGCDNNRWTKKKENVYPWLYWIACDSVQRIELYSEECMYEVWCTTKQGTTGIIMVMRHFGRGKGYYAFIARSHRTSMLLRADTSQNTYNVHKAFRHSITLQVPILLLNRSRRSWMFRTPPAWWSLLRLKQKKNRKIAVPGITLIVALRVKTYIDLPTASRVL